MILRVFYEARPNAEDGLRHCWEQGFCEAARDQFCPKAYVYCKN